MLTLNSLPAGAEATGVPELTFAVGEDDGCGTNVVLVAVVVGTEEAWVA